LLQSTSQPQGSGSELMRPRPRARCRLRSKERRPSTSDINGTAHDVHQPRTPGSPVLHRRRQGDSSRPLSLSVGSGPLAFVSLP
jgi:hypothetical protein